MPATRSSPLRIGARLLIGLGCPDAAPRSRWRFAYLDGLLAGQPARPDADFDAAAAVRRTERPARTAILTREVRRGRCHVADSCARLAAMGISTHVLDAVTGRPAAGLEVTLSARGDDGWRELTRRGTDSDGRVTDLAEDAAAGVYRLSFDTEKYLDGETFYPEVVVVFRINDPGAHHHVPLLLSPFAYSTYRGS